ncbi:MAG: inorganic phosphate transporter [Leptospiraceae bacterium]|nr:inorganic phosphate transporter [Leptospiraceae bacterium]MDW8306191.1 inorganic phosphate transporter [Leptospiraceae bacterium]
MDIFLGVLVVMFFLGALDLIVGVSNDAVNFTNSAMGSRVASRKIIMGVATIGIILGALTSSGMMEIARKGLFHPQSFSLQELMQLFLAVMLTDVILLDLYNTFGLPTSTTVSLVFEILGSAVVLALVKYGEMGKVWEVINAAGALRIIGGIVLSVVVAFFSGLFVQFIFRLLFTFNLKETHRYLGGIFGGLALTIMLLFVVLSALKGSNMVPSGVAGFLEEHLLLFCIITFVLFSLLSQGYISFLRGNIFRVVILLGTGSLALAFAGNDLVNFIGVPLASHAAYAHIIEQNGNASLPGVALAGVVHTPSYILYIAAAIMSVTLWFSRKAQTVTQTEINLASQGETVESFSANNVARGLVQISLAIWDSIFRIIPGFIKNAIRLRYRPAGGKNTMLVREGYAFDLLRASVNIVTASSLIIIGTLNKLPLSTTFVTFMVAMGTSLADRAWGRDNAVFRVSGVLTVIGGWFMTAVFAFLSAGIVITIIYFAGFYSMLVLVPSTMAIIYLLGQLHRKRQKDYDAKLQELAYVQENPRKAIEKSIVAIADTLDKAADLLKIICNNLAKAKLEKLGKVRKGLSKLAGFHRISVAQIVQVARHHFEDREMLIFYSYTSSLNFAKKVVDTTGRICDQVVDHVSLYQTPLSKEEAADLFDIYDLASDLIKKIKEGIMKKSLKKALIRKKWNELTHLRTKIHKSQISRLKTEKSKLKTTVPYLVIVDELVELSANLINLYENLTVVAPYLLKKK